MLTSAGGIAPRSALTEAGCTSYAIGRARHSGRIVRIRRAWYALPDVDSAIATAVWVGGAATCVTVLARCGVWLPKATGVHVSVARNSSRLRRPLFDEATVHWRATSGATTVAVDSIAVSLAHAATCLPAEFALVAIDSALNLELTTVAELEQAFVELPWVARRLLAHADAGSQSGLETLARFRLRRWRIGLRTQVQIPGVGRVDVLIGDRLVLELDGRRFHATGDRFEEDRRRDLALHRGNYLVVRLSYRQVMEEWADAERVIRLMVQRGDHRWPRSRA